ncbi:lysine 2,3-aminomutase, partial [Glycomyces sp. NEAU-7082]|nr:lysine 2,3-aminomutase [Glycomyces albidus]
MPLDADLVARARRLAATAAQPVVDLARSHTTVSVERATLRLAGLTGADPDGIPWVNRLADAVRDQVGIEHGITLPVFHALKDFPDLERLAHAAAAGGARFALPA